jgi:hypothetical protein
VLDQLRFGVRRAGDEYELRRCQGGCDIVQEGLIFGRMAAADGIGLVMNVSRRIVRVDDDLIGLKPVEIENASFAMIDPDDRVGVGAHGNSAVK